MLFGGLLGIYLNVREAAGGTTAEWVPSSITFPEIAVNTVAITLVCSVVIIHWALWAIGNGDRRNTYIALGLTSCSGSRRSTRWRSRSTRCTSPSATTCTP